MRVGAIELGGTKTIAILAEDGRLLARESFASTSPDETIPAAVAALSAWHDEARLAAIGIASFGPVRVDPAAADYGRILATPKPGWAGADLLAPLRRFGVPLALDTDVNGAALAEQKMGAATGCDVAIYLTIGTGIGGGIAVKGAAVHGVLHPEIGHIRVRRADGFAGVCPFHGDCAEGLIAGPALEARLGEHPSEVAPDDPRWQPIAAELAELFATLVFTLSPQRIMVGGGVALKQPGLIAMARARVPDLLAGYLSDYDADAVEGLIVPPALGEDAGPMGAVLLAERAARA